MFLPLKRERKIHGQDSGRIGRDWRLVRLSESLKARPPSRAIWSGRISIGLVNVPVKMYTMIRDESFQFRFVRKNDACPLKYERVCTLDGEMVEWADVGRGYEVRKGEFVVFKKEELDALRPTTDQRIRIDKFVPFKSVDGIYLDKSYILAPDKSGDAYSLLRAVLRDMDVAGVGRFTLRTKEYPILIHEYRGSLLLTTLRYVYEVVDPNDVEALQGLEEPDVEEFDLATKIIENLSGDFDIMEYQDTFRERVEKLVEKKMKGETIVVEPSKREEVKELMASLQETLQKLQGT
jgi:DNA end-binding protein Ku